jgi:DNA polymerase III subunit delta'
VNPAVSSFKRSKGKTSTLTLSPQRARLCSVGTGLNGGDLVQFGPYDTIKRVEFGTTLTPLQNHWPLYGHNAAVDWLQRSLESGGQRGSAGRGPHQSVLLLGPRQVGKSTLGRAYAHAILCTAAGKRPCGECRACRLLSKGSHPDFRLLQPLDKAGVIDRLNGTLRAEQAAELIHDAALRPVEGQYKVFLLQDFHQANAAFANKLLKTLEEPPPHVVLCLTATDRSLVLPTILSRCQILELRPLAPALIAQALREGWQALPDQAELLARLANGRLGWAVQQYQRPEGQEERLAQLHLLWRLLAADRIERLAQAEQLAANRNSLQLFGLLETWLTWWRDLLLVQSGCADQCANVDQQEMLERQQSLISLAEVQRYLAVLRRIEGWLHHTVNTRLALDVLLLRLPRAELKPGDLSAVKE